MADISHKASRSELIDIRKAIRQVIAIRDNGVMHDHILLDKYLLHDKAQLPLSRIMAIMVPMPKSNHIIVLRNDTDLNCDQTMSSTYFYEKLQMFGV